MSDYPHISEGILGENDIPKTNTELFLSLVNQYFPEAIKDGEVDFTALREEMGEFAEVSAEHYDFTWAGKQAAKKEAQADIFGKTLRYKIDDSKNPDTTENIYIEGDNLEALKLLRRNYHGKIKMIYIDPPYNTGNDFVYHDDFSMSEEELAELSGNVVDEVRFQKNLKDSSRYHTTWLNMMYPRLKVARELLTEDGVIFISIDDNEQENLKKVCNEVFGSSNFIGQWNWYKSATPPNLSKKIKKNIEYIFCYEKNRTAIKYKGVQKTSKSSNGLMNQTNSFHKLVFPANTVETKLPDGIYTAGVYGTKSYEINLLNNAEVKNGKFISEVQLEGKFKWGQEYLNNEIERGTTISICTDTFSPSYDKIDYSPEVPPNFIDSSVNVDTTENAGQSLESLFDGTNVFDYPKPYDLIMYLANFVDTSNSILLDFFSGSATTAHAVMQLNAKDGGNRKFIMVQLPETCDEKSEAAKAGYKDICEIGKDRIRKAADKIHKDNPQAVFDDGFKVFEVGNTNIRWNATNDDELRKLEDYDFSTGNKDDLDFTPGHNDIDIVYEIMLRQHGIPLSTPIEKLSDISDRTYIFADAVVVCLEPEIDGALIEKLSSIEPAPARFILRDSAFNDDIELKDVSFRKLSALIRNHQTAEERKNKYNNFTVEFI